MLEIQDVVEWGSLSYKALGVAHLDAGLPSKNANPAHTLLARS